MARSKNPLEEMKEVEKVFFPEKAFTLDPLVLKCLHLRCEAIML